jgi:hypothetical protein
MKRTCLNLLLLASLALQPMLANADHDDRRGWSSPGALDWRLGPARGWQGHEIHYRYPGERQWRRAPGSALDLSAGWVIGTDRRNGGYGIYRWNDRGWQRMPGAGVDIGGSFQSPWVINDRGERFTWTGFQWREDNDYRRRDERGRDERRPDRRREGWRNQDRDQRGDRRNDRYRR